MKTPSFFLAACLTGATVSVWANGFNGGIKGSVDGHVIDAKVACHPDKKPWDWLRVMSDPAHRPESLGDLDGDGLALLVDASRSAGRATINMKIGEATYKIHSGKRSTSFDDAGLRIAGKFDRTEGKGKDQKVVSSYQVDLKVVCKGI